MKNRPSRSTPSSIPFVCKDGKLSGRQKFQPDCEIISFPLGNGVRISVPACVPSLSASLAWVSIPLCIPARWLLQFGIPGWRWRLPAVAVQSDARGLSHGAFPPPRGIGENFQKWPKTCILVSTGPSPTIVLPLLSHCPEVARICKCIDNPEQQREGGREAKTFRLSHPGVGTAAKSQMKPKQLQPMQVLPCNLAVTLPLLLSAVPQSAC